MAGISLKLNAVGENHEAILQAQEDAFIRGSNEIVSGRQDWNQAWKQKQQDQYKKRGYIIQDHTNPNSLLIDKISNLKSGSKRRNFLEGLKGVLDNTTGNFNSGIDNLNKESYREIKRLTKTSMMLNMGVNSSLPTAEQAVGYEEGKMVSNLQSWKPHFTNAVQPISEAIGSHSNTSYGIEKNPMGPSQFLPQTSSIQLRSISPTFVAEIETNFGKIQRSSLVQTPAKDTGSIRQAMSCSLPISLAVPFDSLTDVYGGLMGMVDSAAKLLDKLKDKLIKFLISPMGVNDSLIPLGLIKGLIDMILKFAKGFKELFDFLTGLFSLAKALAAVLAGAPIDFCVTGKKLSANVSNSRSGLSVNVKKPGKFNLNAAMSSVASAGRLAFSLSGMTKGADITMALGKQTSAISNPGENQAKFIDGTVLNLLVQLPFCCHIGTTGDRGFTVGASFDSLQDNSFGKALAKWPGHVSIISPSFNKDGASPSSYAQEDSLDMYDQLPYENSAQGNKGVIMYGPGSTGSKKVFRL